MERWERRALEASLQIVLFYRPVIRQARDKVWPEMQPVWSDKKRRDNDMHQMLFRTLFLRQTVTPHKCPLTYLMKTK